MIWIAKIDRISYLYSSKKIAEKELATFLNKRAKHWYDISEKNSQILNSLVSRELYAATIDNWNSFVGEEDVPRAYVYEREIDQTFE